jgi:hypothetical protein
MDWFMLGLPAAGIAINVLALRSFIRLRAAWWLLAWGVAWLIGMAVGFGISTGLRYKTRPAFAVAGVTIWWRIDWVVPGDELRVLGECLLWAATLGCLVWVSFLIRSRRKSGTANAST